MTDQRLFLQTLQQQAQLQAKLSTTRVLPKQLDAITTLIGNYPWQVVSILSFVSASVFFFWEYVQ